jgi:hypothetical protein
MFDHYERNQAGSDCARKRKVLGCDTQDEAMSDDEDDGRRGNEGPTAGHSRGKVRHNSATHSG